MDVHLSDISGHLDVFVAEYNEKPEGEDEEIKYKEILIHGDPEGLMSLAKILIKIASMDQETDKEIPDSERFRLHLRPKFDLSNSSDDIIIGRLDAKATGEFYDRFIPKET